MKAWESYEEVARYLISQFKEKLGLSDVEGKQEIPGLKSGTDWEIDGKAFVADGGGFLIVECRRYTTSKLSQEDMGGLAFRIIDTGAAGGITVSPYDVQQGAKLVASASNIQTFTLRADSTPENYLLETLNNTFVGFTEEIGVSLGEKLQIIVKDLDGNIVEDRIIVDELNTKPSK